MNNAVNDLRIKCLVFLDIRISFLVPYWVGFVLPRNKKQSD